MPRAQASDVSSILHDIRAGMGDVPIMEKYGLSPRLYSLILERLRGNRELSEEDLAGRIQLPEAEVSEPDRRDRRRAYLLYAIPVCSAYDPANQGLLNDISRTGFQVTGMNVEVDEIGSYVIRSDVLYRHRVITVDAICRWTARDSAGDTVSGFEISTMDAQSQEDLGTLIQELSVSEGD